MGGRGMGLDMNSPESREVRSQQYDLMKELGNLKDRVGKMEGVHSHLATKTDVSDAIGKKLTWVVGLVAVMALSVLSVTVLMMVRLS